MSNSMFVSSNLFFKEGFKEKKINVKQYCVYYLLCARQQKNNSSFISIKSIKDILGLTKNEYELIIKTIKLLKDENLVNYDVDIITIPKNIDIEFEIIISTSGYTYYDYRDVYLINKLGYTNFTIYAFIMNNYNKQFNCSYPSINQIAYKLDLSERTVKRGITQLEELNIFQIDRDINKNNHYHLQLIEKTELINCLKKEYIKRINENKKFDKG